MSTGSTSAAAPFAESWASVPRTAAARKAKSILVFGMEQDITGFNTALTCCGAYWAAVTGNVPELRGAYNIDDKLRHVLDLAASAKATKTSLTYTIRPDANWYWGGKKSPVTYKDFVYTWQQIVDPKNDVGSRSGYDQITGFTHKGAKQITFTWKKPYADWQDLFALIYPSQALAGQDFNTIWANCVCGNDGQPISDGPFYVSNYTRGQGMTLKVNPFWYGKKPGLKEVDFKIITDTNTEVQSMRGGEVDAINPTFGINLAPLKGVSGIMFNQVPGLYQEHIDIQFGPKGQPLLKAPWMRQAIMMGIDRAAIIKTVYGSLAGDTSPLNNIVYYPADAAYKSDFAKWNFNPAKALALLKKHCTGGPSVVSQSNSDTWTCTGYPAKFRYTWTASNATRTTQEAIIKQQLKSIGIDLTDAALPANVVFGQTGVPSGRLRPGELRVGHAARSGRLRADLELRRAQQLPQLLQPQGNGADEREPDGARPGQARQPLPAGGRADGERRPDDPDVRAAEPAHLEVGHPRHEEQPVAGRVHLERRRLEVEVVGSGVIGARSAGPDTPHSREQTYSDRR